MDKIQEELKALRDLEATGTALDDAQKATLANLKFVEEADKTAKSALAQKDHFREKFEQAEKDRKALEEKLNKSPVKDGAGAKALDVEDYIGISTALEGLDSREKEYIAKQHKLTGKSLQDLRKDEDFTFWQSSYQAKVEKEKQALKPTGTQSLSDKPSSLDEKLANASLADKEKLLIEAGYYKPPRGARSDRVSIGTQR